MFSQVSQFFCDGFPKQAKSSTKTPQNRHFASAERRHSASAERREDTENRNDRTAENREAESAGRKLLIEGGQISQLKTSQQNETNRRGHSQSASIQLSKERETNMGKRLFAQRRISAQRDHYEKVQLSKDEDFVIIKIKKANPVATKSCCTIY